MSRDASTRTPADRSALAPAQPRALTDAQILRRKKRNGKFAALWTGESSGYQSPSEGDVAVCVELALVVGKDEARIDHLFRQSGRYRDEWDAPPDHGSDDADLTYGEITIARAMAVYDDRAKAIARALALAPPPTDPDGALIWMNQRYAAVQEAGKTLVLIETHDEVLDRRLILRSTFSDIKAFYSNRQVLIPGENDKITRMELGTFWLKHPARRQYTGVTFAPRRETPGLFNLWQGFGVEPLPGTWSLMASHIANIICAGHADLTRWLMAWMADAVQHPERPAEIAVVLRGPRGSGKGVFARSFGRLFSPHFVHVSNPCHLLGNFNAHLQDAIVVFADEVFLAGDRQAEGVLKMIITEPIIPIERKHRDVVSAKNVIHLVIASNDAWVVPAGHDERRFAVFDVAAEHSQDHSYFAALEHEMQNGGLAAMLHDLLRFNYSDVNLRQAPMTAALFDQKLHSLGPFQRWWYDKLMSGWLRSSLYPADKGWPTAIAREDLQRDYLAVMKEIGTFKDRGTETELGMKLRDLLPPGFPQHLRRTIPGSEDRPRLYVLPDLATCRRHFASKYMKADIPWPSEVDGQPSATESQPTDPQVGRGDPR